MTISFDTKDVLSRLRRYCSRFWLWLILVVVFATLSLLEDDISVFRLLYVLGVMISYQGLERAIDRKKEK